MTNGKKKPPRPWELDDLLALGAQGGARYLKAVPVLVLEKWVRGEREEGKANFYTTDYLRRRVVGSGLREEFEPRSTSNLGAALSKIQSGRNLNPLLVEHQGGGRYWANLPHYETLLQEYRKVYSSRYQADYDKLFPEGEPKWELLPQDAMDIRSALAALRQLAHDQERAIEELVERNANLRERLGGLEDALQTLHYAPTFAITDQELKHDCSEFLQRQDTYIDAIRRAGVVLEERLRKTIGGDGPERFKSGKELVDYALTPKSGKLVISDHPGEQEGVRMLFRGALQFVRNPPGHKKVQYSESEAHKAILLIDYLLTLLKQTRLSSS
jgi:uncharacterized protein (TIGR02391 family)